MNENNANFTSAAPNFKTLVRMSFQRLTNFPYIEEDFDALTNYGLLSKVVEYLNEVISNNNKQNTLMTNLYNAYVSLQDYVNVYFDNLDVQDEINNKLESMAADGSLTALIKEYVDPYIKAQDAEITDFKNIINGQVKQITSQVSSLASGSPKGVYATVAALESANPDTGVYIVSENGHIYSWTKDATSAIDLGVYTSVIDYDKALSELTVLPKNFNLNKINLFDNLTFYHLKSIPFNDIANVTVNNFENKLVDNSYGNICKPFKIKLDNGTPIIDEWNFVNLPSTSSAVFMYYFKKDGSFLSYKNLNNPDVRVIPNEAYYASIFKFNNLTDYYVKLDTVNVEWLNKEETFIVDINGNGDYTSLMACFTALKNNTNTKIIKIMDGTYDIFEEIGGSEFATSITSSQKWNDPDVSIFVPDNTKLIGCGNVVLNFLPEQNETNQYAAQYLSPINVQGNCEIENIKIYAKNCRYCIHDETANQIKYENGYRKYKGVECHYLPSSYGTGPGGQCYAAGFTTGMNYEFDNCIFDGQYRNQAFSMHNGNNSTKSNNIYIRNCIFKAPGSQGSIAFFNTATIQLLNNVYISNCHLNNSLIIANNYSSTSLVNAFKLYINNSNNFNVDVKTTINDLTPEVYNAIGS